MQTNISERQRLLGRWGNLKTERNSWQAHWQELSDYIQPRRSRFLTSDRNQGGKKNDKIINGIATWATETSAAGMMAGITSPARPWFRLTVPDQDLADMGPVKAWLHVCEERLRTAFQRSNIYNGLHSVYVDLITFGTACLVVEEDTEDTLRAYVLPMGQYALANNARQRVDTVYRELSMTVGQMVEAFGLERCSEAVKSMYEARQVDQWRDILHVIEPRKGSQYGKSGPANMALRSCWLEQAGSEDKPYLRESGYEEFPVMCPRWSVTGEDVYGSSPAMNVLGDAKALQVLEKRKAQVVEKIVNPPMKGPASLANGKMSLLPGGVTYVDSPSPGQTFSPALEINPSAVRIIEQTLREHEGRIQKGLYADLWLSMSQADSTMTAREVVERHEEKMLQLGPVMERLQDELLDPLIDRAFNILLRRGDLPPPPQELQGTELRVEYISVMAQAQKLIGTSGVERLASFVGNLAAVRPDALDKIDFDQMIDEYGNMLGVPPGIVRPDEDVAKDRQAKAQAAQQQQQMEQASQAVQGAKTLSETDMQGDTALNRMLGNLGGPASAGRLPS